MIQMSRGAIAPPNVLQPKPPRSAMLSRSPSTVMLSGSEAWHMGEQGWQFKAFACAPPRAAQAPLRGPCFFLMHITNNLAVKTTKSMSCEVC